MCSLKITDDNEVFETILPEVERQALIAQGYTKLSIMVHLWLYEENDSNKDFWIMPYYGKIDGNTIQQSSL